MSDIPDAMFWSLVVLFIVSVAAIDLLVRFLFWVF
jgi:hypothetical protein